MKRQLAYLLSAVSLFVPSARAQDHWVASWAAAPVGAPNSDPANGDVTVRNFVHLSAGGSALRLILTNEFGTEPLAVGGVTVALTDSAEKGSLKANTLQKVTFSGKPGAVIPPGSLLYSDPVQWPVLSSADLAVSIFVPAQKLSNLTVHTASFTTNYVLTGNQLTAESPKGGNQIPPWRFLKGIDVNAPTNIGTIVCFGDSITDGAGSTVNGHDRWPDLLANRLQHDKKSSAPLAVINEGIGGNRILHPLNGPAALARFDRDVLAQSGVRYLVILEGINDIGHTNPDVPLLQPVTAEEVIAGLQQMIDRAHSHGIKVIGATLTPYGGAKYSFPAGEEIRSAVNAFIRTSGHFDGVIDFERAVADPSHPKAYAPAYDHGDHLHPNAAGYRTMASSIDLSLFAK